MAVTRLVFAGFFDMTGCSVVRSECQQASLWLCLTEIVRVPHFFRIRTAQERTVGVGLPQFESVHLCLQRQADLVFVSERVVDSGQALVVTEKWIVQTCTHRGIRTMRRYAPGILTVPREVCQLITEFAEKNAGSLEYVRNTTIKIPGSVMR